jgi:hypothetical protein
MSFLDVKLENLLFDKNVANLLTDMIETVSTQPLFSSLLMAFQFTERNEVQVLFESLKENTKYIFVIFSIALMMLIPLMYCYFLIEKYFNFKLYCNKLRTKIHLLEEKPHQSIPKWILDKYRRSYADYLGNGVGIGGWIVFSLLYMLLGFDEFREGISTYFNFPFDVFQVLQSLGEDNWNFIGSEQYRTWIFMLIIAALSIFLWILGRGIGEYLANKRINELTKTPLAQLV